MDRGTWQATVHGVARVDTPELLTQHFTIHDIGGFTLLFVTSISLCKNSVDFIGTFVKDRMRCGF